MERRSFVFAVASAVVAPWLPDVGRLLPGRPVRDALPSIPPGMAMVQATRGTERWAYEPVSALGRTCVVEVKRPGRGHRWRAVFHGRIERIQFDGPTLGPRITLAADEGLSATVDPAVVQAQYAGLPHEWRLRILPA